MVVNHFLSPQFRFNFDDSCIYRDVSSNLRMAAAAVRFVKFEKYNFKLFLQRKSEATGNYLHCFCFKIYIRR